MSDPKSNDQNAQNNSYLYSTFVNSKPKPYSFKEAQSTVQTSIGTAENPIELDRSPVKTAEVKSKLCVNYNVNGYCPDGNDCKYAHGVEELANFETAKYLLCKDFERTGSCIFEAICCPYIHRRQPVMQPIMQPTMQPVMFSNWGPMYGGNMLMRQLPFQTVPRNYKTALCKNFEANGFCKYENVCHFIHRTQPNMPGNDLSAMHAANMSMGQLPIQAAPSNVKTALCKNIKEKGFCTYGDRCFFVHPEQPAMTQSNLTTVNNGAIQKHDNLVQQDTNTAFHQSHGDRRYFGANQRRSRSRSPVSRRKTRFGSPVGVRELSQSPVLSLPCSRPGSVSPPISPPRYQRSISRSPSPQIYKYSPTISRAPVFYKK